MVHSLVSWWSGQPGAAISDAFGGGTAILFILYSAYAFYHKLCAWPTCFRVPSHPVKGTSRKVCSVHHTLKHHEALFRRSQAKHPERLAHGESHELLDDKG